MSGPHKAAVRWLSGTHNIFPVVHGANWAERAAGEKAGQGTELFSYIWRESYFVALADLELRM